MAHERQHFRKDLDEAAVPKVSPFKPGESTAPGLKGPHTASRRRYWIGRSIRVRGRCAEVFAEKFENFVEVAANSSDSAKHHSEDYQNAQATFDKSREPAN